MRDSNSQDLAVDGFQDRCNSRSANSPKKSTQHFALAILPSLLKPAIHAVAHILQDFNLHSFIVGEYAFEFAACVTSTSQMVDFGRSGQTRTGDVLIPNQVHCQLCYTPNFKTCIRSSFLIYAGSAGGSRTPRSPGYGPGEKPLLNRAWSWVRDSNPW